MKQGTEERAGNSVRPVGGLAVWLLNRLRGVRRGPPRLAVLERITLAPRQSLVLIEAEGRRFLVATSAEGTPAFYALDVSRRPIRAAAGPVAAMFARDGRIREPPSAGRDARVSW